MISLVYQIRKCRETELMSLLQCFLSNHEMIKIPRKFRVLRHRNEDLLIKEAIYLNGLTDPVSHINKNEHSSNPESTLTTRDAKVLCFKMQ